MCGFYFAFARMPSHDDMYALFLQHFDDNPRVQKRLKAATKRVSGMVSVDLNGMWPMQHPRAMTVAFMAEDPTTPPRVRFSKQFVYYECVYVESDDDVRRVLLMNFPITTFTVSKDPRVRLGYFH